MRRKLAVIACLTLAAPAFAGDPKFKKHEINARSVFEAAGAFDVDGDGKVDVVSGDTWYKAPNWEPHPVRPVTTTGTYRNCFSTIPLDVNGDGRMDFITCSYFEKNVGWVENPGPGSPGPWAYHAIDTPGPSEAAMRVDLTGDGEMEFLPNCVNEVVWYSLDRRGPRPEWKKHDFGAEAAGHGVGAGDVNGDGRTDILTPKGWFEAPSGPTDDRWAWHPDWNLGAAGIGICVRDANGDGLNDVVFGNGHDFGLFWLKQSTAADGSRAWARAVIDATIASVHTLIWADMDGDGKPFELVTGKRVYAHEIEPGATDGSVIAYYSFDQSKDAWAKHVIYQGEPARKDVPAKGPDRDAQKDFPPGTAGTGLELTAIDLDSDGDLDLVCPGKSGLYWFENLGPS